MVRSENPVPVNLWRPASTSGVRQGLSARYLTCRWPGTGVAGPSGRQQTVSGVGHDAVFEDRPRPSSMTAPGRCTTASIAAIPAIGGTSRSGRREGVDA
jgi:hypothetical protein